MIYDREFRRRRGLGSCRTSSVARRRRGSMLIIALGVLTLLAVLGTTFVQLMKLERKATRNYVDAQLVDLVNQSALDRVIADLRGVVNHFSWTQVRSPWVFEERDSRGRPIYGQLAHGRFPIESDRVGVWYPLLDDGTRVLRYKTKVIDCAAQINLNDRTSSLPRLLENLGEAIARSRNLRRTGQNPLYTKPRQGGQQVKGVQLIQFRNKLEGHRFRSKSQLRHLIGDENYQTIKDFITVHSWEDPNTFKPTDGIDEVDEFRLQTGGGRQLGGGGGDFDFAPVHRPTAPVGPEPRSPININTAPEEVITACLMGVGGRRAFPYSRLVYSGIDQNAQILGQRVIGQEETRESLPRGVWVYMRGLRYPDAQKIAQRLVQWRKNPATQFRTWSSGSAAQPGFMEFINKLDEGFFPNPNSAKIIDPVNPQARQVNAEILGGASEVSRLWQRGHHQRERQWRREFGLPFHNRNAFYYDLAKASLIANFNPNTRINRHNPNVPAFTPVDKSDLVVLDERDPRTQRKGYTTEFCFDSMGIFEITTLGDLAIRENPGDDPRTVYARKTRTIVKVYDVVQHTNQFHFERTFSNKFGFSSRESREYVVTWPEPMEALTDVVTRGSVVDGRIELIGLKDGIRKLLPPASRLQTFRSPESVIMAEGFQDRDDQSYAQLKRLARTAPQSQEINRQLSSIFDADYCRTSALFRRRYSNEELQVLGGVDAASRASINRDVVCQITRFDSDLRPDGLHTSLFTTGHLGAKFLLLPSHSRRGQSVKGGRGSLAGAGIRQNVGGNVPYYNGGIGFWVKFEFDGSDPVFSGLIGCTSVIEAVGPAPPKDTEGTQFYIFKNTKGQLRVVRMYYHQAFPDLGGGDGGEGDLSGQLWPPVEVDSDSGDNQILDLDPRKPVARSDVIIDISHFRAHEWHHLAVEWNDASPQTSLRVFIDFEPSQGGGPFIAQETMESEPTAWVRLNVRGPKDGLFVGGFIRKQKVDDAGVFKWFTNTLDGGDTRVRRLTIIEPSVKRIIANATIDELVTYEGTFPGVRSYFVPRGAPGYFAFRDGRYANLMELPLPPGVSDVVLRSFDWTIYRPTFYTGNDRQPRKLFTQPVTGQVHINSPRVPSRFREPWRDPRAVNRVAGYKATRPTGQRPGTSADLVYRFQLPPGRAQSGSFAGGSMQTPVIDDVTLTYYLPSPRILHQEEEE